MDDEAQKRERMLKLGQVYGSGARRRAAFGVLLASDPALAEQLLAQPIGEIEAQLDLVADRIEAPNQLLHELPMRETEERVHAYEPEHELPPLGGGAVS